MTDSEYIFISGEAIEVGRHGDHDFVFASGEAVTDSGKSEYVFEAGTGVGGAWATLADLPSGRTEVFAESIGGYVYVTGGDDGTNSNYLRDVYRYDPDADDWSIHSSNSLSVDKESGMEGVYNGKMFCMGGEGNPNEERVDIYDPSTATWDRGADLSSEMRNCGSGQIGNTVYGFGSNGNAVEYDMASESGSDITTLDSNGRTNPAGAADDSYFYIAGGNRDGTVYSDIQRYNPSTDSWTKVADLPAGASNPSGAYGPDGNIYIFAVGGNSDRTVRYNPDTGSVDELEEMPSGGRGDSRTAVTEDTIYVIAGGGTTDVTGFGV